MNNINVLINSDAWCYNDYLLTISEVIEYLTTYDDNS